MFSLQQQANAQVVAPTFPQQFLATATPLSSINDDVTVNCDMLSNADGQPIRAIVWDDGSRGNNTTLPVGMVHLYVADYAGHSFQVDFPGAHPDVVLCDDPNNPGVNYRVAVAHVDAAFTLRVSYYFISGVGSSSLAVGYIGFQQLSYTPHYWLFDTEVLPHIDITPDLPGTAPGGLPLMHRFVATFENAGGIYYATGDVGTPTTPLSFALVDYGTQPDVSGETDVTTGNGYANIVYRKDVVPQTVPPTLPSLALARVSLTSGTFTISTLDNNNGNTRGFLLPRIESMNLLNPAAPGAEWEVACIVNDAPSATGVYGYNTPAGKRALSSYFSPGSVDERALAVAAGTGTTMGSSPIGNRQYTVGYFPRQTRQLYARVVDAVTGIETRPYYQINNTTLFDYPTYYEADVAKSLAISNCSNSGRGTLSVWYDGNQNMFQKLSMSVSVQFKATGVEDVVNGEHGKLYPNPSTDYIRLNEIGVYKIYDMQGRLIMNGEKKTEAETINVEKLPAGAYMLQLQTESGKDNYPFIKQ
ncbi:MAG TPA: T9SS type A sorting domain-containing protein [Flavipsychrobacter sp.]|nr:T9SS type A sorting domain-containing protein [Flavipsychrobacter sp.]